MEKSTNELNIAWLAGILDGEGCITAKKNSVSSLFCRITIEAVSLNMIAALEEIFRENGVDYSKEGPIPEKLY